MKKSFFDDIDIADFSFKISDDVNNEKLEIPINEFGLLIPHIL